MKTSTFFISIMGLWFTIGCGHEHKKDLVFQIPSIANSSLIDSSNTQYFEAKNVIMSDPIFIGKYKFGQDIDIGKDVELNDSDFVRLDYGNVIDDSLDVNGFELVSDYSTTVWHCRHYHLDSIYNSYYPVYLINSSRTDKLYYGKDNHGFGIQEAVEHGDYDQWYPIEAKSFDFCGNGAWRLRVRPGEFILLLLNKYKGEYRTKLRTRIVNRLSVYVSKPYDGYIDKNQFEIRDSLYIKGIFNRNDLLKTNRMFYGAIPKGN